MADWLVRSRHINSSAVPDCFVPIYKTPQLARRAKLQGPYLALVVGGLYFATSWGEREHDNIARYNTCL